MTKSAGFLLCAGWKVEPEKVSVTAGNTKAVTVTLAASGQLEGARICLVGSMKGGARFDVEGSSIPINLLITLAPAGALQ